MNISEDAFRLGRNFAGASKDRLAETLNDALNNFISNHYRSASGYIFDCEGKKSEGFAAVVYTASANIDPADPQAIPADATAAIVDVYDELDLESFRAAYARIAHAKTLKKAPVPGGATKTNITLGIILAARSAVPLEFISEELDRLNTNTASSQWPDMIAISSNGVINYGVQFPGESISGDFLPPAEGAFSNFVPSLYVVIVMRPTGLHTFNKMLAFLLAHIGIFSPEAKLPPWDAILEGTTKNAVTLTGFQYNLKGELVPVPRQFYNDRYLPPRPLLIQDQRGTVLSTIQFMPWQDGGTILLRGKLPLEGLLVFLGKDALRGGVIKRPNLQISHVLPITAADFNEFLKTLQRQTNMIVRNDSRHFVIQKLADEGASSPFMARIFLGILHLRDAVFSEPITRDEFDKLYDFVTSSLLSAREASVNIKRIWDEHARKVASGEIARRQGPHVRIEESIDKELRKEVESFLNAATRALKTGMQNLGKFLDVDIGFLFKKPDTFEKGISRLSQTMPELAEYLRQTRVWSEPLIKGRNDLEHEIGILSRVTYTSNGNSITASEPSVGSVPVTQFVSQSFDRLICFVEEFSAYCLQRRMPSGTTITELALSHRQSEVPERFRVTLAAGGLPPWRIASHVSPFEES